MRGVKNSTALIFAAENGQIKVAEILLANGASINVKADNGITALMIAVAKGHLDVIEFLTSNEVEINAKNIKGHTALDIANDLGDQRVIAILKSNGAKAEQKSLLSIGITALIGILTLTITLFTLFKQKNK